jgi:hypothetical protein
VRAIGSAPAAGGSIGRGLDVKPGGWSRYERLDFGAGAGLAAVRARVNGAGTLVFTLGDLEGTADGVRIATLTYNATALPNDALRPGWAIARSTNITTAATQLSGLQTVYVQFWPLEVTTVEPPIAPRCTVGRCTIEGADLQARLSRIDLARLHLLRRRSSCREEWQLVPGRDDSMRPTPAPPRRGEATT